MRAALVLALVLPVPALAAFPERISILAMDDFEGASTESLQGDDYVRAGYEQVVLELGSTLANKPMAPARTLGVSGFHVGIGNTLAFIQTGSIDGINPAGWDLADPDEEPMVVLFVPQVQIRKGLPASLEVGANFGWLGLTETGTVGAYGRWGIIEGYRSLPDLSIQMGYVGYVGNDELEMGVLDFGANIGYTLPFGPVAGINVSRFSPFVSLGVNRIHAAPRADLSESGLEGRVTEVTGFTDAESATFFDAAYAPFAFGGGIELESGDFTLGVSGSYASGGAPAVNTAIGFNY
ncbi:MAG: hypothetical protein FJ102_06820 [Deltaproteobacteria bacterium]|nr:hypothetical protein [Deltaproteobacteria bacterium]